MTDAWTLRRIEPREIRMPLREPFRSAAGTVDTRRILLLELEDGDGLAAWSECVAGELPTYTPETIDTAWLAVREWLAPRVLGVRFDSAAEVGAVLERGVRGHRMARAAVEMGTWGLDATRRGSSLATLIGGTETSVETGIALGAQSDPAVLVERAIRAREMGYRRIKVKIGPGHDFEPLAALRGALGREAPLMADANSAYTLADTDLLVRLDELGLLMIEQPLAWDDLARHAELQKRLRTPICLDESITGPDRVEDMVALGGGRIVNLKPGRVGGLSASLAIHDLARHHRIPLWCGGMLETGIGRAYNVALASLPGFTLPGDLSPSARYWERDVVAPEWTMDGGQVKVPRDRPGLGVEVDHDRLEELTVRRETVSIPGGGSRRH